MTATREDAAGGGWHRVGVLVLAVVAVGLPLNNIAAYAALLIVAVIVFCGYVTTRPRAWVLGTVAVFLAALGQAALSPPRIEEGHNVFLPSAALEQALPADVYRRMLTEFDALYPPARRCDPKQFGCWQHGEFPDSAFAFSADGIWHKGSYSRTTTGLDFADPVWLRLGFINDLRYNWYTAYPDVHRADRERGPLMGLKRWHLAMPWYEVIRLPAEFVGGELCWSGTVMWEREGERFDPLSGGTCRTIEPADAGRRIFGIAIKPDTLSMRLSSPWRVAQLNFLRQMLALAGLVGLVAALVQFKARRTIVPFALIGLAIVMIAVDDASFIGGVRPFDGGDDGLFYDSVGRVILQKILSGDFYAALEGGEKVFYYGGPGLRYFRAIEHAIFGETYLGYLSFILLLPFLVHKLFRRFLPERWSLGLTFLFVAIPIGVVFGTTFVLFVRWAARGFADPLAYILFIAGLLVLLNAMRTAAGGFTSAFLAALLFAFAIFVKPFIAPGSAVLLGGAGLIALCSRRWDRLAGLCIGFLPVFSMALHNWVYGHVLVLFSANSTHPDVLVMPPSAYLAAAYELLRLDFHGTHVTRGLTNIASWLTGPSALPWRPYAPLVCALILLHAAALVVVVRVTVWGRTFDPWLRLIGASALAQHALALFYTADIARYHFLTWFLTMLVVMVWFQREGVEYLQRRYPALSSRFAMHPLSLRLASWLERLQKVSA